MSGGHGSHDMIWSTWALLLRPRCIGAERPRTQLLIYLSLYLPVIQTLFIIISEMVFSIFYQSKCCVSNAHSVRLPSKTQNWNWFKIWGSHSSENQVFCLLWWDSVWYVRWYHWSRGTALTIRVLASSLKMEKTMILKFIWCESCISWIWTVCINGDSGFLAFHYIHLWNIVLSYDMLILGHIITVIYHHSLYTHHVLLTFTVIPWQFILNISSQIDYMFHCNTVAGVNCCLWMCGI